MEPKKRLHTNRKNINICTAKHVLAFIDGGRNLTTEIKKRNWFYFTKNKQKNNFYTKTE